MEVGAFSISLAVKDIEASRRFYEEFGFQVIFNPGWDQNAQKLDEFADIRVLQRRLRVLQADDQCRVAIRLPFLRLSANTLLLCANAP